MTAKTQWLAGSGGLFVFGLALIALDVAESDEPSLFVIIAGVIFAVSGGVLAACSLRSFSPNRRLPEELRLQTTPPAPRTLVLTDGQRILATDVLRGGYVLSRRSDPAFDARDVVALSVSTPEEIQIEGARRPQLDKTHRLLWFVSNGSVFTTFFGLVVPLVIRNAYVWVVWSVVGPVILVGCILRLAVLRRRQLPA
jgi:hypothetical protein